MRRFMQSASNYVMQSPFDEVNVEAGTLNPSEGTANRVTHPLMLLAVLLFHCSRKSKRPSSHNPAANDAHPEKHLQPKIVRGKKRRNSPRNICSPHVWGLTGHGWRNPGCTLVFFLIFFHQLKQLDIQAHLQMANGNIASLPWSRSWPCAPRPGSSINLWG